jgi:hypothetical protein
VPDFGRPARLEAIVVTQMSLYVAFLFWGVELYVVWNDATPSIIENFLESALDFASTAVVLYRLSAHDALVETPRNTVLEARTSATLAFAMFGLGAIFIANAAHGLAVHLKDDEYEVASEVFLSAPSAILYIVVGMMQLQMSWTLRLRSLKQDAIISLLGAIVAVGTLVAALVNMTIWVEQEPVAPIGDNLDAIKNIEHGGAQDVLNKTLQDDIEYAAHHWRFWYLEDVITICTALILVCFGLYFLVEDARAGHRWWTPSFWCDPLPPPGPAKAPVESTPLKK